MYPFVWVREGVFVLKMEFDTALNIKLYRLVHFLEMREYQTYYKNYFASLQIIKFISLEINIEVSPQILSY